MANIDAQQLRGRLWVLLAMDACDRGGISPIPKDRFHRLIFLSNCLAQVFGADPPAKRIIKYKRGPFYPDIQWQIDRLVTMQWVDLHGLLLEQDQYGAWLDADYQISGQGIKIAETFSRTPLGQSTAAYIDELVFGFARLDLRRLDDIPLNELNWRPAGEGALITFEDADANLAVRKTAEFQHLAPEVLTNRLREQVQLYLRYIEDTEAAA
jgi:hypothetical protein